MTIVDEQGRTEPPDAGDEVETLVGFLEYQRATLAWKCRDLDADGLSARLHPTTMTLGGMLKHMAFVEENWFSVWLHGNGWGPPWNEVDYERDWEWESARDDSPEELWALWEGAVQRSRELLSKALADGGLDRMAQRTSQDGRCPSLRWILVHMIEEYARHNGHADLLRESIDGLVGE